MQRRERSGGGRPTGLARWRPVLGAAATLAVLVVGGALLGQDEAPVRSAGPVATTQDGAAQDRTTQDGGAAQADGLPTVAAASLPEEARRVLALIEDGGPFRYDKDGSVFGNREGLLPPQPRGCYREYTVPTPGESDRGARRIVTSCAGPRYWTADHYESFARITGARL